MNWASGVSISLPKLQAAMDALAANEAEGFPEPMNAVKAAVDHLRATLASAASGGSVCARVRIRLDHDVVQARQGFKATLELDNGGTSPLENIRIQVVLLDANGNTADPKFVIFPPDITELTGVEGHGTLAAGINGKATWLIVPGPGAAPKKSSPSRL